MTPNGSLLLRSLPTATFAILWLQGAAGCGGRAEFPTAPLTGTITYRGKPLPHGQLVLVHESGPMGAGAIQMDGSYEIRAPIGENLVMVVCEEEPPNAFRDPPVTSRSLIPARYTNYMTSGLTITVNENGTRADWSLVD